MLPETPEEIAAREERLNSARKRKKIEQHVAEEEAQAAKVQARVDEAQALLDKATAPRPPDPEAERARAEAIALEQAEAERVRALGPEPGTVTSEQLAANPSDYLPGIEANRERALHPSEDEQRHREAAEAARARMLEEERGGVAADLARPAVPPVRDEPVDTRQLWVCVGADGIRSMTHGELHPLFRSDAHMVGQMVTCPKCGETTVRKVSPDEDLHLEEDRAIWASMAPHQRELVMAQRRTARDTTLTTAR